MFSIDILYELCMLRPDKQIAKDKIKNLILSFFYKQ